MHVDREGGAGDGGEVPTATRPDWRTARVRAHALGASLARPSELVGLDAATGRVLAADVVAPHPVPGHDASAMDGWVVAGDGPWRLGEPILAGDAVPERPLEVGAARPITTGAPVPPAAEAVIRSEDGAVTDGMLAAPGRRPGRRHIRPAGEEIAAGDRLLAAGTSLTPPRIALAAAAGVDVLAVAGRPRAAVAVLGDEVVGSGVPAPGLVRDVFTVSLPAILTAAGARCVRARRLRDDADAIRSALADDDVELVVTTGGTAGGAADHVRGALAAVDADLVVDRVALRPGAPTILARRNGRALLALPGNPLAAMVAMTLLGVPLVAGMLGMPLAEPATERAGTDLENPRDAPLVVAVRRGGEGVVPVGRQGAAMLRGLAEADALVVVPAGGIRRGDPVPALALPWPTAPGRAAWPADAPAEGDASPAGHGVRPSPDDRTGA